MKFFPSFLNPFRRIRELEADLADQRMYRSWAEDSTRFLRSSNAHLSDALDQASQALDAFMDDREELKLELAVAHQAGLMTCADLLALAAHSEAQAREIDALDTEADQLDAQLRVQASETLEVITWAKQVEASLAAVGIEVVDGEGGPMVVIDETKFVASVSAGLPIADGQRILQAA